VDVLQIKYFLSLVENRNFSVAAEECNVAQSTISKQIAALENELGTLLFIRSGREIKLSETGHVFLEYAEQMMETHYNAVQAVKFKKTEISQSIVVGTYCLMQKYNIASAFAAFNEKSDECKVIMRYAPSWTIRDTLDSGACDFCIMYDDGISRADFAVYPLFEDSLALVVSDEHELASESEISIFDLDKKPMAAMETKTQVYKIIAKECKKFGINPEVTVQSTFPEPLLSIIQTENVGLLFPFEVLRRANLNGYKIIPLTEKIRIPIVTVFSKSKKSKLLRHEKMLINFLKEYS
jgi:DNA-binding transcriptional LysR family regulator